MTATGPALAAVAIIARAQAAETILAAEHEVACDGCGVKTSDAWLCDHFTLCPDCTADPGCAKCQRVHDDERGSDLW